jgi:hypothetical protein
VVGLRHCVLAILLPAAVVTACASIMGVEEATVRDTPADDDHVTPLDEQCDGAGCPCDAQRPCREPGSTCVDGACRPCSPEADTCPANTYCLPSVGCAPGCKSDAECEAISPTSPFCNLARHYCVACRGDQDCEAPKRCSPSGACKNTCADGGAECPANETCCGSFCIDTRSDLFNCGSCGNECSTANGAATCTNGSCTWTCNPGFEHCATGNTGCESHTLTDPTRCGGCNTNCNTVVVNATGIGCAQGKCTYAQCNASHGDCDNDKANGCECDCGYLGGRCCPGSKCVAPNTKCSSLSGTCIACKESGATCAWSSECCSNDCQDRLGFDRCK